LITIVGLGPLDLEAMSAAAFQALESAQKLFLRTRQHPAAYQIAERGLHFETFDSIYEAASSFDEVYSGIANRILEEARQGDVTYAVPGHPLIAERSVALITTLAESEGITVRVIGSQSFIEACLEALILPVGKGLKLIDALEIDSVQPSPDCPNLIYQVYDRIIASSVKLALMEVYPDEFKVHVIYSGGGPGAKVETIPLFELDHREFDYLTSVFVPELP